MIPTYTIRSATISVLLGSADSRAGGIRWKRGCHRGTLTRSRAIGIAKKLMNTAHVRFDFQTFAVSPARM